MCDERKPTQQPEEEPRQRPDPKDLNAIEKFYENFRKVPVRVIDRFIWGCVAALVLIVVLGMLKSRGVI